MAKTYINTVKYLVKIKFEIDGIVDKPDIVGAIFGQSEGLLGDEMDLKELQKNGKLGRIEINFSTAMGRTKGEILVPSSMDMAETSLLAAGIESVDKVGPCEAKLEILDIEDTRNDKRKEIKDRAKEILKRLMDKNSPDTQSLSEEIRENARAADIVEFGPDKLPSGPDIEISEEIIVVEGRADVINLLKNQIKNVIGMNGSNISQTIVELSKRKQITAFVDGDRGGELNARKLTQMARVEYIAKAPDGKEVEELTRKEILQSLKKRIKPALEVSEEKTFRLQPQREYSHAPVPGNNRPFENRGGFRGHTGMIRPAMNDRPDTRLNRSPQHFERREPGFERPGFERQPWNAQRTAFSAPGIEPARQTPQVMLTADEQSLFRPVFEELKGTTKARILDESNQLLKEVKVKDIVSEIEKAKNPKSVVLDGVITKRLVDAAEKAGAKYVIGARKGKIEQNEKVKAATL